MYCMYVSFIMHRAQNRKEDIKHTDIKNAVVTNAFVMT